MLIRFAAIGALLLVTSCRLGPARNAASFWRQGADYSLTLVATERPCLISPELRALHSPLVDTTSIPLKVGEVRGDSIFGVFEERFRGFGIMIGAAGDNPQHFLGVMSGRKVFVRLVPYATDAGMTLDGVLDEERATGQWVNDACGERGTFILERVMSSNATP